jgi:excisionase family DNA binding protein
MDDIDATRSASKEADFNRPPDQPLLYTVAEAAVMLRIGRTLAYDLVKLFEASGGRDGLPAVRLGGCWRIPREAVSELGLVSRAVSLAARRVRSGGRKQRRSRARRVGVARSVRRRPGGSSEQLFLLPPSD